MALLPRIAAFGITLGVGLAVLASISTEGSTIAHEGTAALLPASSVSSPNPNLLKRLTRQLPHPWLHPATCLPKLNEKSPHNQVC